jgi:chromosome segregation ATPase
MPISDQDFSDLRSDIRSLIKSVDEIRRTQDEMKRTQEEMKRGQEEMRRTQDDHTRQLAHLEGKIDMLAMWQQSTDQRFTAIMTPYHRPEPPPSRS